MKTLRLSLGLMSALCFAVAAIPGMALVVVNREQKKAKRRLITDYPHLEAELLKSMEEDEARLIDAGQKCVDLLKQLVIPAQAGGRKKHPARVAGEVVRAGLIVARQFIK